MPTEDAIKTAILDALADIGDPENEGQEDFVELSMSEARTVLHAIYDSLEAKGMLNVSAEP